MDLERQLRRLRSYALVTYPFACVPFLFLFFTEHRMDAAAYGEILTAYYATMFLAEVPTGVLGDRLGARRMLVAGPVLLALGFVTFLCWREYPGFILGEVLLGLGHSVLSGPPSVALYETLKAHGVEGRYLAEESRIHARRLLGTGAAFLLGGALVHFGNDAGDAYVPAIAATAVLSAAASALASRLQIDSRTRAAATRREPFLRLAIQELAKRPVRWLLLYWMCGTLIPTRGMLRISTLYSNGAHRRPSTFHDRFSRSSSRLRTVGWDAGAAAPAGGTREHTSPRRGPRASR